MRKCLKDCVSDVAHAVIRSFQALNRPSNIMVS